VTGEILAGFEGARRLIRFDSPLEPRLDQLGHIPLPPYIHQQPADPERYQTVYAREPGSAAAPTAGLHFTPGLLDSLRAAGVGIAAVTLHVGLDTFAPVNEGDPRTHKIHSEWCRLPPETAEAINTARQNGGRVVCVGTTSVRTTESAAGGAPASGVIAPYEGATELFILPGYTFRAVDALVTNFHLPKSTLLMMISAFAGREAILRVYEAAKEAGYRFYSFGDAMLIL
jgi:S-adenosylmethionine:tRNA ribosyltransferase-isomerase